jgi:hypothetical protein
MIGRRRIDSRHRIRRRTVAIAASLVVGLVAVSVAGIGTANASSRQGWWGHRHPKPARTHTAAPRPPVPSTAPSRTPEPAPSSAGPSPTSTTTGPTRTVVYAPPPANAGVDYQIGEAYTPPPGVGIVSRDHGDNPAAGKYNICYVNGFQTQTSAAGWWRTNHDDLLLKRNGQYVMDGDWNEMIMDISTPAKRDALAKIVGSWIDECAAKGFQAVEPDNLDTWTRSEGLLTQAHAVAFAKLLAAYAHSKGLAIGQKNAVEWSTVGRSQVGFDFAVAESCADYDECQGYVDVYGNEVLIIEYDDKQFQRACGQYGARLSIVMRDRNVTAPGSSSYVFKSC